MMKVALSLLYMDHDFAPTQKRFLVPTNATDSKNIVVTDLRWLFSKKGISIRRFNV